MYKIPHTWHVKTLLKENFSGCNFEPLFINLHNVDVYVQVQANKKFSGNIENILYLNGIRCMMLLRCTLYKHSRVILKTIHKLIRQNIWNMLKIWEWIHMKLICPWCIRLKFNHVFIHNLHDDYTHTHTMKKFYNSTLNVICIHWNYHEDIWSEIIRLWNKNA